MTRRPDFVAVVFAMAHLSFAGCSKPVHERLNTPPQGPSDRQSPVQPFFTYQTDNALMTEMAIYDMHFIPGQATLSGTGEVRLARYSELLADSGGTLHYQSNRVDDALASRRIETARSYLSKQHGDSKSPPIVVEGDMTQATGMDAPWGVAFRNLGMAGWGARKDPAAKVATGGEGGTTSGGSGGGGSSTGANSRSTSRTGTSSTSR